MDKRRERDPTDGDNDTWTLAGFDTSEWTVATCRPHLLRKRNSHYNDRAGNRENVLVFRQRFLVPVQYSILLVIVDDVIQCNALFEIVEIALCIRDKADNLETNENRSYKHTLFPSLTTEKLLVWIGWVAILRRIGSMGIVIMKGE